MRSTTLRFSSRFTSPPFSALEVLPPLAAVIGVGQASQFEATERLQAYVAKHRLARDDGTVTLDTKLRALVPLLGSRACVTDTELADALTRHLR
jgi:chromatin remodeling complex protein RSC6